MRCPSRTCRFTAERFTGLAMAESNGISVPKPKAKPRVEKNRVLVTGGAGFVGSHLCAYLVNRGDHVSVLAASLSSVCGCINLVWCAEWGREARI